MTDDGHGIHQVNFASVLITCTVCLKNGHWDLPLENECKICGLYRRMSFAPFQLIDPSISDKHVMDPEPLKAFLQFVLKETNKQFVSHVFAHNSGKYGNIT